MGTPPRGSAISCLPRSRMGCDVRAGGVSGRRCNLPKGLVHRFRRSRLIAAPFQARALRAEPAALPLVLMSMSADDGDVERFGRGEARAVLAPPYQLRAIRAAVRAVSKEYA